MGFIYCISHNDKYFKIGVSRWSVEERLSGLQIANPIKLKLIWDVEANAPFKIEKELHDRLSEYRVHGEWFSIDYDEAINLKRFAESLSSFNHDTYDVPSTKKEYAQALFDRLLYYGEISRDSRLEENGGEYRILDLRNHKEINLSQLSNYMRRDLHMDETLCEMGLINRIDDSDWEILSP